MSDSFHRFHGGGDGRLFPPGCPPMLQRHRCHLHRPPPFPYRMSSFDQANVRMANSQSHHFNQASFSQPPDGFHALEQHRGRGNATSYHGFITSSYAPPSSAMSQLPSADRLPRPAAPHPFRPNFQRPGRKSRKPEWRMVRSPTRAAKVLKRTATMIDANEGDTPACTDFGEDLTVTIQCKPSKEPVGRQDNSFFVSGTVFCETCNVSFAEKLEYREHLLSASHLEQYNLFCKLHQKKTEHLTAKSEESPEKTSNSKLSCSISVSPGKSSFCKTCKSLYQGDVIQHRQTSVHKANKILIQPYCTQCSMFFKSPAKFILHCNSPTHHANRNRLKEQAALVTAASTIPKATTQLKDEMDCADGISAEEVPDAKVVESSNAQNCTDGDQTTIRTICELVSPVKEQDLDMAADNVPLLTESSTPSEAASESPRKPIGTSCVMPIKGFYCTVCSKLFTDKYTARVVHCQSKLHHDNYKARNKSEKRDKWRTSSLIDSCVELVEN